jgi:AcrR family transcriptional regulator
MGRKRSDTSERLLREAMRLFAKKGYERTSVPEIQDAAGLTPGSGALYKHFPSKEAVIREGIERYIEEARAVRGMLRGLTMPPRDGLDWIARESMAFLATKHDELRILWRDVEYVPRLQAKARREIVQASYDAIAAWLRDRASRGEMREHDSEAVAAVIFGSITMFRIFEAIWGERTVPVDDERFIRAWHDLVTRGLGIESTPQPVRAKKARSRRSVPHKKSKS